MKVEIWSDYLCPYCYLGTKRFHKALKQIDFPVEIVYRSFELNPFETEKLNVVESLMRKYYKPREYVIQMIERVQEAFKTENLVYNYEQALNVNTNLAHYLGKLAIKQNKYDEVSELLFLAHFKEGKDLSSLDVLLEIAEAAGLNKDEVKTSLLKNEYRSEVDYDRYLARQYQIKSVPRFIVNDKYAIVGAQSVEYFVEALQNIRKEQLTIENNESLSCTDDGCY